MTPQLNSAQEQQIQKLIHELRTYKPIGREGYEEAPVYRGERFAALRNFGAPVIPYLLPYIKDKSYLEIIQKLGGPAPEDACNFFQTSEDREAKTHLLNYLSENPAKYKNDASLKAAIGQIAQADISTSDSAYTDRTLVQVAAAKTLVLFGDRSVAQKLAQLLDQLLEVCGKPETTEGLLKVNCRPYQQCAMALGFCHTSPPLLAHLNKVERFSRTYLLNGLRQIPDPALFQTYLQMADLEFSLGIGRFQTSFTPVILCIEESAVPKVERENALQDLARRVQTEAAEAPDALKSIERALERVAKSPDIPPQVYQPQPPEPEDKPKKKFFGLF